MQRNRVVSGVLVVMEVVVRGLDRTRKYTEGRIGKLIPTVVLVSMPGSIDTPGRKCRNVHAALQNHVSGVVRQNRRNQQLGGMHEENCDADCDVESVVNLVDPLVKEGGVQEPMSEIEEEVFPEHAEAKLPQDFPETDPSVDI